MIRHVCKPFEVIALFHLRWFALGSVVIDVDRIMALGFGRSFIDSYCSKISVRLPVDQFCWAG